MRFCGAGDQPAASIVICAYQSLPRIGRAIAALRRQDLEEPFEVIAVISGNDGCDRFVSTTHPDVRVISAPTRIVPGRARNLGVEAAAADVVAFVPDDGVVAPGWLRARLQHHRAGIPLVGGAISNGTPRSAIGTACYYVEYAASMPVRRVLEKQSIPHTLSYKTEVFDVVGRFPELDVPGEDTVLNQRCVEAGLPYVFEPHAVLAHLNLTELRAFLEHQFQHGRGLARCTVVDSLNGPFTQGRGRRRLALLALVGYPLHRWFLTFGLVIRGGPRHTLRFLALTPLVLAGYLAGGRGAWRELEALGAPSPSVQ